MEDKKAGIIPEVSVTDATFVDSTKNSFTPGVINFFYGQNGTGKSTVADAIINKTGIPDSAKPILDEYEIVYFNQDFVNDNLTKIKSGDGLGAVFVLDDENRKLQQAIKAKNKELSKANDALIAVKEAKESALKVNLKESGKIENEIWSRCERYRNAYKSSSYPVFKKKEASSKIEFANALLNTDMSDNISSSLEIEDYYKHVILATDTAKKPLLQIPNFSYFIQSENLQILHEPLFNTPTTQFGSFLKKFGITDDFKEYHEKVHGKTEGKCPYCMRDLPQDFDKTVEEAFDESYTEGLVAIKQLYSQYSAQVTSLIDSIKGLINADWASPDDKKTFIDIADSIIITLNNNLLLINNKIKSPGESILLHPIKGINELSEAINANNKKAIEENARLSDKNLAVEHFREMLLGYMASMVKTELVSLSTAYAAKGTIEADYEKAKNEKQKTYNKIKEEIEELSKNGKDTSGTVDAINKALLKSGFSGFHLEEINPDTHAIQVIRDRTKKPAIRLSEGEKNFLMFLYFYYKTKGSSSEDGTIKDKIVVIDDPVSSMDSRALFIISSLTKELIGIAASTFDPDAGLEEDTNYIKQFFLLTHNPYFFRDATEQWIEPYKHINFYEITKPCNISRIELKRKPNPDNRMEYMNDMPVKNAYNSLWKTYLTTDDKNVFMVTCQQILNHYFVQTCSIKGTTIVEKILKTHQPDLVHGDDYTDYHIVQSMLSCLTMQIEDDFFYDTSAIDIDNTRIIFENIFQYMGHSDHYNEMKKLA